MFLSGSQTGHHSNALKTTPVQGTDVPSLMAVKAGSTQPLNGCFDLANHQQLALQSPTSAL
jgi:hypothetical protein